MFKFPGKRPQNLGVSNGKFKAKLTGKPNWVSSQISSSAKPYITPLAFSGSAPAAMQKLKNVLEAWPQTVVVEAGDDYLHAECSTPLMGFTDDLEFYCDTKVIHVRSASRLGHSDLGANRKRVESLRAALGG